MLIEAIRTQYDYDRWATEQVLDTAEGLTTEQWLAPGTAGQGSIRDTLVHVIACHKAWRSIWDSSRTFDEIYADFGSTPAYPDVAAVRAAWREVDAANRAFMADLTDATLQRRYTGTFPWSGQHWNFALWQMMLHVANHSTQHRSEAAAMMTAFGCSPGYLDLMGHVLETSPAVKAAAGRRSPTSTTRSSAMAPAPAGPHAVRSSRGGARTGAVTRAAGPPRGRPTPRVERPEESAVARV
jgi:uncharacterized damage-inducible protein DinB